MKLEAIDDNVILKKTVAFSLATIKYCEKLEQEKRFIIAKQLFRSATSIGANSFEAQNNESPADFVHKFKVAAKEANETQYWLVLCQRSYHDPEVDQLLKDLDEIERIINKIITSSKGGSR